MPLVWILIVVSLAVSFIYNSEQVRQERISNYSDISATSLNMLVYRNAVATYAQANPEFNGNVPDSQIVLPSWYIKSPYLANYVTTGKSYTYFFGSIPGLAGELARLTGSVNVGTNQNGILLSPNMANIGITLPPQIPNSAVVLIQ
ncbi:type IV pilus biogenesis protein PilM [Pseudomonas sp. S5F11]|jgi:hypothetical protein|uniref:type IV pilus biogenesis protein PilM n=1 Tax=Pseudomonas sp. S5F11 TaxID=2866385 RepID=UPI001C7DDF88|nr:type IV pilus biogenesis protein PilM [Pseudomonas sp. S5F11]MBX4139595.1 type IV pilus biogenesis protein PilM [Pseudomonas sp. S5F11]